MTDAERIARLEKALLNMAEWAEAWPPNKPLPDMAWVQQMLAGHPTERAITTLVANANREWRASVGEFARKALAEEET